MALKRFVIELGYGTDLHGGDITKAARRAVQDALSRSCLCGLFEILGMDDLGRMHVAVRIGCTKPEQVDREAILEMIPFGTGELEVVSGGLSVRGTVSLLPWRHSPSGWSVSEPCNCSMRAAEPGRP